jgi:hypothetical protein
MRVRREGCLGLARIMKGDRETDEPPTPKSKIVVETVADKMTNGEVGEVIEPTRGSYTCGRRETPN